MRNIFRHPDGGLLACIGEIRETDDLVTIRFKGAIDASTIPVLESNFKKKAHGYVDKNMLLDFKEVTHVDSATIAALVLLLMDRKETSAKLALVNLPDMFKNYLKIERIDTLVPVFDSEPQALAAFVA